MQDVVIVDAARSAVGKKKGSLGWVHPTDTLGPVMMKLLERNGLESGQVDQVDGGGYISQLASSTPSAAR